MTARIGHEDPRLQRLEQATLWLQRMRMPSQDERMIEAWLDWCQRDPLNQQAFDEIAEIWEATGMIPAEPAVADAPKRTLHSRRALAASVAGLGLAVIAGAWWMLQPAADKVFTSEFSSPTGINSVHTLADGSVLELGGGTQVTVSLGRHQRRIALSEGELFVKVHHDTSRPFSVETGGLQVIATGTAFNVLHTPQRTTVTVAEGSVAAFHEDRSDEAPNVRLKAGQQLIYSHVSHTTDFREVDPRDAIAWRSGELKFLAEPLSEVISTINRYATRKIVIDDPQIGALAFTGTALTKEIERWVQGLPHSFEVSVVDLADGRHRVGPRGRAPAD